MSVIHFIRKFYETINKRHAMDSIIHTIKNGNRITKEDAQKLYQNADFLILAALADNMRKSY